jgi:uncharacterized protein (DUF2384 family)
MEATKSRTLDRLSAPALRAFFKIADAWDLKLPERQRLLGGIAKQTIYNWRDRPEDARLTSDQIDRISYVLGIYKALNVLFTRPEQADTWIRRPNTALPFDGRQAADLILSGRMEDLIRVRRFLDGVRGAW